MLQHPGTRGQVTDGCLQAGQSPRAGGGWGVGRALERPLLTGQLPSKCPMKPHHQPEVESPVSNRRMRAGGKRLRPYSAALLISLMSWSGHVGQKKNFQIQDKVKNRHAY